MINLSLKYSVHGVRYHYSRESVANIVGYNYFEAFSLSNGGADALRKSGHVVRIWSTGTSTALARHHGTPRTEDGADESHGSLPPALALCPLQERG